MSLPKGRTVEDVKAALAAVDSDLAAVAVMSANQWLYHFRSKNVQYYKTAEHRMYADKDPNVRAMRQERARQQFFKRVIDICNYDPRKPPRVKLRKRNRR
jgi:hypothetical protein